ncbi:MAG: hypothetical protein NOU37_02695 [Candidatus Brocadiales bacterium]|nr:hypothetical protein [Candidatus Bathyanammoxibius amoris]
MTDIFRANCAATAIGSFPHADPDAAFGLILKTLPEIPCWPQLPKRGIQEEMCVQYTEGMPFFHLVPEEKRFYLEVHDDVAELENLHEKFSSNDASGFSISPDYAAGIYALEKHLPEFKHIKALKGQIVGPITLAANLKDAEGTAALFDPTFNDAVIKLLCLKARWQIDFLSRFKLPLIIFADEPFLSCMGSAFATVSRDTVTSSFNEVFRAVKSRGAMAAIHCCGNTDWDMVLGTELDILSFDAFIFMDKVLAYSANIQEFVGRGGILAWGIAPTTADALQDINSDSLVARMEKGLDYLSQKGIDKQTVLQNSLITPSCGTGTLTVAESEKAMSLTHEVSTTLKERYGL